MIEKDNTLSTQCFNCGSQSFPGCTICGPSFCKTKGKICSIKIFTLSMLLYWGFVSLFLISDCNVYNCFFKSRWENVLDGLATPKFINRMVDKNYSTSIGDVYGRLVALVVLINMTLVVQNYIQDGDDRWDFLQNFLKPSKPCPSISFNRSLISTMEHAKSKPSMYSICLCGQQPTQKCDIDETENIIDLTRGFDKTPPRAPSLDKSSSASIDEDMKPIYTSTCCQNQSFGNDKQVNVGILFDDGTNNFLGVTTSDVDVDESLPRVCQRAYTTDLTEENNRSSKESDIFTFKGKHTTTCGNDPVKETQQPKTRSRRNSLECEAPKSEAPKYSRKSTTSIITKIISGKKTQNKLKKLKGFSMWVAD